MWSLSSRKSVWRAFYCGGGAGGHSWDLGTHHRLSWPLQLFASTQNNSPSTPHFQQPLLPLDDPGSPSTFQHPCPFQLPCRRKGTTVLLAPGQPGASQWSGSPASRFWPQGFATVPTSQLGALPGLTMGRGPCYSPETVLSGWDLRARCTQLWLYREGK